MKKNNTETIGTGEDFETAKDALSKFDMVLRQVKDHRDGRESISRFGWAVYFLSASFDAANKMVDDDGESNRVIDKIIDRVFAFPEIVRAIDEIDETPKEIIRECKVTIDNADCGIVCAAYSSIVAYFLKTYENDLIEKIEKASGGEKERLERELSRKRFEMFPLVFNKYTHGLRKGATRFFVRTPFAKEIYPFCDMDRECLTDYGNCSEDPQSYAPFALEHDLSEFLPDENGKIKVPFRGGGGCRYGGIDDLYVFGKMLKKRMGIEDRVEPAPATEPAPAPVSDFTVSEYAARYVRDYQTTPEERFTFMMDDGTSTEIDLDSTPLKCCKFLKRLMSESRTSNHGWVVISKPEWLKNRKDVCKLVKPIFDCLDYRKENGVESFRIIGKRQEWTRGPECKKSCV